MKIGLLHLTDLHLKSKENFIIDRVDNILSSIKLDFNDVEYIYIVASGDIVDKGNNEGYSIAKNLLNKLKEQLALFEKIKNVKFVQIGRAHV